MANNQFRTLHAISLSKSQNDQQSSGTGQSLCSPMLAAERARVLLGSYRSGSAEDPGMYCAALVAVMTCYPDSVVVRVTDPRTGLPSSSTWLPSVAELRQACEREMQPVRDSARRAANAERNRFMIAAPNENRAAVMDRMREKFPQLFVSVAQ